MVTSQSSPLLGLPLEILIQILEKTDYKSLQLFGRTCKVARNIRSHVYIPHEEIKVFFFMDGSIDVFHLKQGAVAGGVYKHVEDGCSVQGGEKKTLMKNEDTVQIAYADFESLLKNQRTKLKKLTFASLPDSGDRQKSYSVPPIAFCKKLEQYLSARNPKLQVDEFSFHFPRDESHVMMLLSHLNPVIQKICLFATNETEKGINNIAAMEHWRNAEAIEVSSNVNLSLEQFIHVRRGNLDLKKFTVADSLRLKEMFCEAPTRFDEIYIQFPGFGNQMRFHEIPQLGPANNTHNPPANTFNPQPEPSQKVESWLFPTTNQSYNTCVTLEGRSSMVTSVHFKIVPTMPE